MGDCVLHVSVEATLAIVLIFLLHQLKAGKDFTIHRFVRIFFWF